MSFMPFYAMEDLDGIDDGHNHLFLDMMGLFFVYCVFMMANGVGVLHQYRPLV